MGDETREMPLSCPECGGPLTIDRKVRVESVSRAGGRDLPIGDRTDILKIACPEHGVVERIERVTPAGHAIKPMSMRFTAPSAAPEQRWHEIATEGLPPANDYYFVAVEYAAVTLVEQCEWFKTEWLDPFEPGSPVVTYADKITHWWPIVEPAPPTKEPR